MKHLALPLLLVGVGCQTQTASPVPNVAEQTASGGVADSILAALPELERRVARGDTTALPEALRLRHFSDGHVSEELDIILGSAILPMPEPLLRALRTEEVPDHWLDGITGNLGPAYVDRLDAQQEALLARKEALLAVTVPQLLEVRDRLVAELESQTGRVP